MEREDNMFSRSRLTRRRIPRLLLLLCSRPSIGTCLYLAWYTRPHSAVVPLRVVLFPRGSAAQATHQGTFNFVFVLVRHHEVMTNALRYRAWHNLNQISWLHVVTRRTKIIGKLKLMSGWHLSNASKLSTTLTDYACAWSIGLPQWLVTLRANLSGAVYCNRSCLWMCVGVFVCSDGQLTEKN